MEGKKPANFCADCFEQFETLAKYKYHRLKKHGKWRGQVHCRTCGKSYETESNLRRHVRKFHAPPDAAKPVRKYKHCPDCDYKTTEAYCMTVHRRKHTGERPFVCEKCEFGFYKKSDLANHFANCKGPRYTCEKCNKPFHFKRQYQEHLVWSRTCGNLTAEEEDVGSDHEGQSRKSRYMERKPSLARLNINQSKSVLMVNCDDLIFSESFEKRKKRSRCGVCAGCVNDQSCADCNACLGITVNKLCYKKRCLNLVDRYVQRRAAADPKNDQVLQSLETLAKDECATTAGTETQTKVDGSNSPPSPILSAEAAGGGSAVIKLETE